MEGACEMRYVACHAMKYVALTDFTDEDVHWERERQRNRERGGGIGGNGGNGKHYIQSTVYVIQYIINRDREHHLRSLGLKL